MSAGYFQKQPLRGSLQITVTKFSKCKVKSDVLVLADSLKNTIKGFIFQLKLKADIQQIHSNTNTSVIDKYFFNHFTKFLGTVILRSTCCLFIFHRYTRFVDLLIVVVNIAFQSMPYQICTRGRICAVSFFFVLLYALVLKLALKLHLHLHIRLH